MRLLLVEDEKSLSKAIKAILESNNYSVDAVFDGEEALSYLQEDNYDGIILDIMLPKKDGLSVLKELRKNGSLLPVLMLTAKSEVDDKVLGLDLGANDYLTKPFEAKELLARIRAMTRSRMTEGDSVMEYGNVALNRSNFLLFTKAGEIKLSNKEFQMMELLMRRPQNLISAEKFMDNIWGFDAEADISVVWVYISYLRKKLVEIDANVEIKVTRNLGYSLNIKK